MAHLRHTPSPSFLAWRTVVCCRIGRTEPSQSPPVTMPRFLGMESHIANDRTPNLPILQEGRQAAMRESANENSSTPTSSRKRLVSWLVAKLRPHPSYARLGISISSSKLNVLLELGEDAFLVPLLVTSTGYVIDGYARLKVARLQGITLSGSTLYAFFDDSTLFKSIDAGAT